MSHPLGQDQEAHVTSKEEAWKVFIYMFKDSLWL